MGVKEPPHAVYERYKARLKFSVDALSFRETAFQIRPIKLAARARVAYRCRNNRFNGMDLGARTTVVALL